MSAWRRETARGNPKLTGEKKSTMKTDLKTECVECIFYLKSKGVCR